MPLSEDPLDYRWPVSGKDVLLFTTGVEKFLVDQTCLALLQQGARNVMVLGRTKEDCLLISDSEPIKGEVVA